MTDDRRNGEVSGVERGAGRLRPLIAVALLAFLPIGLLSVVLVEVASNAVQAQAESHVGASARASASAVEQELGRLADVVAAYGKLSLTADAIAESDGESMRQLIASMYENDNVDLSFVVDVEGVLLDVLPETPDAIGRDFSHRDWYRGAQATGGVYVSEAYQPATDLSLVVVAATPVFAADGSGETIGYIGTGLSLVDLQQYIDDFAATQGVEITVTDQDGVVVAIPGMAPTSLESIATEPTIAEALAGGHSLREVDRDGASYFAATSSVDTYGWTVTAEVATADAMAARSQIVTAAFGLAALLAVFSAGALAIIARALGRHAESVEQRRESEAFLESIIENIPSVVSVKQTSDLRYVQINRAGLEMFGLGRDALIGKNNADFIGVERADVIEDLDRSIIERGTPVELEAVQMPRQFGARTLNVKKIPIVSAQGETTHLLEISEDVTDLLASVRELETAWAEAEKANAAKSEFLSRMSHELRTPLNAVLGFGQLLEFEELTDGQKASVEQILRGGRHLLGLINEVLDISRIETGNLSLSLEPVALEHLIGETLELVRPLADEAGLSLPDEPTADWSTWVRADQQRLRQVMLNLLSNAVKYNRPGGSIAIRCTKLQGKRVRIAVTDTGPGLASDKVDRLFSPFERLDAEERGIQGTGLGLALTKRLVEAMHGTIGLETEPGIGSTFWVELGSCQPVDFASGAALAELDAPSGEDIVRLLHVEDSLDNLRRVESLLADHGDLELISVADAETALDMAIRFQPALILLDLDVTGVDPEVLVDEFRRHEFTMGATVVTMGPAGSTGVGGARHLVRPIADAELVAAVADAMAMQAATSLPTHPPRSGEPQVQN